MVGLINNPRNLDNPDKLENHNNTLIKLHSLLHKKLFLEKIQSCNTKDKLLFYIKPKDKNEALHDNFIRYGTKNATSFLIIDIDHVRTPIEQYRKEVEYKLGIKPTWITKTSKGYHVGFILQQQVYLSNTLDQEKLIEAKKNLTNILNGDVAGSHRLIGYWRNPLTHKSIISVDKLHTINELYKISYNQLLNSFSLFDKQETNIKKIKDTKITKKEIVKINLDKVDKEGFAEGNRNNYLFTKTISMLYNGKITTEQVEDTLIHLNNNELPIDEIKRISKSIQKYNIQPNIKENEKYKPGEYYQELWDNNIHNYKDKDKVEFSRQKLGQTITTGKIIAETIRKLLDGYTITYKNNEIFNNNNIEKNSKVSRSTIKRYRNVRKLEQEIKSAAFMRYIASIVNLKSVKADEPPLKKLVNLALSELNFEYKKTGKVFAFMFDEGDRLIFYEVQQDLTLYAA